MTLGETIRTKRRALGMTQADLARVSGYGVASIAAWEQELWMPRVLALCDLAIALQMSVNELVDAIKDAS